MPPESTLLKEGALQARPADPFERIQHGAVIALAAVLPLGQSLAEITLVVGLLALAVRMARGYRSVAIPRNPLNLFLAAWLVWALLSFHNSVDFGASLQGIRKLLKGMALYLLILDTADSWTAWRQILVGSLIGLFLVTGDGLWQALAGEDLVYGQPPAYTWETVRRLTATFDHPADLAIYLVSVTPLAIAWGMRSAKRWKPALWGLSLLSMVIIVLSRTRGGFLGFLGALVLLAVWMRRWGPLVLAGGVAGLQALTTPAAVKAWAATMPTWLHQLTEPLRLMIWQASLNMIKAHPVSGVGVNTFVKVYPAYRVPGDEFAVIGPYAHNQYLHLAAELGVVGLAIFLALLVAVFLRLRRRIGDLASTPLAIASRCGLGAGFAAYLFYGLFESSLFYGRGLLTFWLLTGLIMAAGHHTSPPQPAVSRCTF